MPKKVPCDCGKHTLPKLEHILNFKELGTASFYLSATL
jgi:hypothetical protein